MRFLFLLTLAINVALFAYGQGLFGITPSEEGRNPRQLIQHNPQAVKLGAPSGTHAPNALRIQGATLAKLSERQRPT